MCDFNAEEVEAEPVDKETELEYFFGHQRLLRATGRVTRWVHVDATQGLDRLVMLRLSVKYHLHPLAIADIHSNRTTSKMDRYAENYFISMDIIALAQDQIIDNRAQRSVSVSSLMNAPPPRVRIHRSSVSISLAGNGKTLLTIHQERPDESSWLAMWRGCDDSLNPVVLKPINDIWKNLLEELKATPPRRMREEAADFLVYEILSRVVAELRPVVEAYAMRLGYMRQQPARFFRPDWVQELADVQLELADLARSIRPMRSVVRRLIEEEIASSAKTYLEDVVDLTEGLEDDVSQLTHMARNLEESQERHSDKRMNDTLFFLSIVTAMFLPAQFWTGVYGMNFDADAEGVTMQELGWPNGYLYFWMLAIASSVIMMVILAMKSGHCRSCDGCLSRCCCCTCRRRPAHTVPGH
jgi:Mg2+ and Co2+ transporter CorA